MRPVLPCVLFFMVVRVVCAADLIVSRHVRGKMDFGAHLYDFARPTYDRAMAISILQKYLTDHHKHLSTYDRVRILTKMAQIYTIHNIDTPENIDQAASHMRRALAVANGKISEATLWCALDVSNANVR